VQLTEVLNGNTSDLLSGLFPRFIMVPYFGSEKSVEDPPPADPIKKKTLVDTLRSLSLCGEREYVYSPEALAAKHKWLSQFNKRAELSDLLLAAFYRKMRDEHFHKVAMLSAFERGSSIMEVSDVAEAASFLWPVEREWGPLLSRLTQKEWDREADRVEAYIQKNGIVDRTDLLKNVRGIRAQKLTAILDGLKQDGKVTLKTETTEGRSRSKITWNT
jgi:hypothetical protein